MIQNPILVKKESSGGSGGSSGGLREITAEEVKAYLPRFGVDNTLLNAIIVQFVTNGCDVAFSTALLFSGEYLYHYAYPYHNSAMDALPWNINGEFVTNIFRFAVDLESDYLKIECWSSDYGGPAVLVDIETGNDICEVSGGMIDDGTIEVKFYAVGLD